MTAVCGLNAAEGMCEHSVSQQLSTMPLWIYRNATQTEPMPPDPWHFPSGQMGYYNQPSTGAQLVDPTCGEMARFAARFVAWYTAGGFVDECGRNHSSGLYYKWEYLSVLNEDEKHMLPSTQYTTCFDRWRDEIANVNPKLKLIGPEGISTMSCCNASGDYGPVSDERLAFIHSFLDPANHKDQKAADVLSFHVSVGMHGQKESMFEMFDTWYDYFALPLQDKRDQLAPQTQLVMNGECDNPPTSIDLTSPSEPQCCHVQSLSLRIGSGARTRPKPRLAQPALMPRWPTPRN
eukprot:SAG22_NODE_1605_length_4014_cov_1.785696_2_plen_292_part_00